MESRTGMTPYRTVIIGSGNVASTIAPALEKAGAIKVDAVYSPTPGHAADLASVLYDAIGVNRLEDVPSDAEVYLLAVKDAAIKDIVSKAVANGAVWLHTSGGVDCAELSPLTSDYGVFYPLQTFSKGVAVDLSAVPVFIEGATAKALEIAGYLARAVSDNVHVADGATRCKLHAAAVFACNFTNHLWAVADDILRREAGVDIGVLAPLMRETLRKALSMPPACGQTGPAMRGDDAVMEKHAAMLAEDEARLYRILSRHIQDYHIEKSPQDIA